MPLVRFDIVEGRSVTQVKALLNAAHSGLVAAFGIPESDRYQIIQEHPASHFIMQDTGLGIARSSDRIIVQVTTRPRTSREKQTFYHLLCESLAKECGVSPSDVVVSMVTTIDEDWSFGFGRAQFLTGELEPTALQPSAAPSPISTST
jgi:phenylpyruvate tautomerase PptA (4-oxalocrotonate tautomerase family)